MDTQTIYILAGLRWLGGIYQESLLSSHNKLDQTSDRKRNICSYEGIIPLTDINTGKVGRDSGKRYFLKAGCYSIPCWEEYYLRNILVDRIYYLFAVLSQHGVILIVFPTNATRYTQLARTQSSFAWMGCTEYKKNGLTKIIHTEPDGYLEPWNYVK